MKPQPTDIEARSPATGDERERYYKLRWRVLRAPWSQPRGSEKDDREDEAIHAALWDGSGAAVAVGRVHLNSATEAQIRFMAVDPSWARKGLGSKILAELEASAAALGAQTVVLNSRQEAQEFYRRNGYDVVGEANTLFGAIAHLRMEKKLSLAL